MADPNLTVDWTNAKLSGDIQLFPKNTISGIDVTLLDFGAPADFGEIAFAAFMEARAMMDGMNFYGGVWSAEREIQLPIFCQCGNAAKALNQIRLIDWWFSHSALGDGYLKIDRDDSPSGTVQTKIEGFPVARRAFLNSPAGGNGVIGKLGNGQLLYIVTLACPYPHFVSRSPEEESGSWSGSQQSETMTNNSPNEVGVYALIKNASSVTGVTITNDTTDRYITVSDTFAATVAIDWYGTSPNELAVYRGSTDLMDSINVGAKLTLIPGDNSIKVDGTGTSFDYEFDWYEAYDSI